MSVGVLMALGSSSLYGHLSCGQRSQRNHQADALHSSRLAYVVKDCSPNEVAYKSFNTGVRTRMLSSNPFPRV